MQWTSRLHAPWNVNVDNYLVIFQAIHLIGSTLDAQCPNFFYIEWLSSLSLQIGFYQNKNKKRIQLGAYRVSTEISSYLDAFEA